MTEPRNTYERLLALLDKNQATYRLIDHDPEGRTEVVSAMRGHPVEAAAKCMILMIKLGKKVTKYVLGVVPGTARIDLNAVKALWGASYVSFASPDIAEELSGSVVGTVLPFSFDDRLELVVDPEVLKSAELYFNAARLDRSMALATVDYKRIANPRVERLVAR
jgi:Ala-tRNA(Pro) deacylase